LRREIHEGLNVIENWNNANGFIFYGEEARFATNQLEDQETACLPAPVADLPVYINTLLVNNIGRAQWANRLTKEDLRALTLCFYNK